MNRSNWLIGTLLMHLFRCAVHGRVLRTAALSTMLRFKFHSSLIWCLIKRRAYHLHEALTCYEMFSSWSQTDRPLMNGELRLKRFTGLTPFWRPNLLLGENDAIITYALLEFATFNTHEAFWIRWYLLNVILLPSSCCTQYYENFLPSLVERHYFR